MLGPVNGSTDGNKQPLVLQIPVQNNHGHKVDNLALNTLSLAATSGGLAYVGAILVFTNPVTIAVATAAAGAGLFFWRAGAFNCFKP